jgi:hypothetical protein
MIIEECREIKKLAEQVHEQEKHQDGAPSRQQEGK